MKIQFFPTKNNPTYFRPRLLGVIMTALAMACFFAPAPWARAQSTQDADQRLAEMVRYLASDKLEGRGVGTKGIDLAADYIAQEFQKLGLKTALYDQTPFQKFKVTISAELGPASENKLIMIGPPEKVHRVKKRNVPKRVQLSLGKDFHPLAIGGSGSFDLPLVFVGYGITGKKEKYDDYRGIDVKDKAVIILRHEPQQNNPHSVFNGTKHSHHAFFRRKVSNAFEHGAAAVIFCNDEFAIQKTIKSRQKRLHAAIEELVKANDQFKKIKKPSSGESRKYRRQLQPLAEEISKWSKRSKANYDPVFSLHQAGSTNKGRSISVLHCRRAVIDEVLQASLGTTLAALERQIDQGPSPQSKTLTGWRVQGQVQIQRKHAETKNVVAILEGQGPLAEETIVIGAHYDHLGFGGHGSLAAGKKQVHNGADDNASGTAVLIEIARELSQRKEKLRRRIVFVAFSGEEIGLLGSAQFVRNPVVPIKKIVAMLNMDMVGRLRENKLVIHGTGTAAEFDELIDRINKKKVFKISKKPSGYGPSDHTSFSTKKVPVLHFFTGAHKDYHRPSDDFEKLNIAGMRRIGRMITDITIALAQAEKRPTYQATVRSTRFASGGNRPYFGSIPDFTNDQNGYAISGVTEGSPAKKAGVRGGDVIIRLGDSKIGNLEDFDSALRKHSAGDKVPVVVRRDGKTLIVQVILDPPR